MNSLFICFLIYGFYSLKVDATQQINIITANDPIVKITKASPDIKNGRIRGTISSDVTLNCLVENRPPGRVVRWFVSKFNYNNSSTRSTPVEIVKDQKSLDVTKYVIEKPTSTSWRLRVKRIAVSDEGLYSCVIILNKDNANITASVPVYAYAQPVILEEETSSNVLNIDEFQKVKLTCNASGRPRPTITWRRQGDEILPEGGIVKYSTNLDISSIKAEHRGLYYCEASNILGKVQRRITLSVRYKPIIQAQSRTTYQKEGYKRTLICYVSADPIPRSEQLTWSKNGFSIVYGERIQKRILKGALNKITSELVILDVKKEDYGNYSCIASTTKGSSYASVVLKDSEVPMPDKGIIASASVTAHNSKMYFVLFSNIILLQIISLPH